MRAPSAILAPALLAVPLFAVTNADDLVLLTVFFANRRNRTSAIVAGQLIGIGILTLASILIARLALHLPDTWLPLLGLAPVAIGIRQFFSTDDEGESLPPAVSWATVATVTVANGGDNLAVYVPVFANSSLFAVAVICGVFFILTLVWCGLARQIVRHPRWGTTVQKYSNIAAPYVLILVGLWVLAEHPWIQAHLGFSN